MSLCVQVVGDRLIVQPPSDSCAYVELVSISDVPAYVSLFDVPENTTITGAFVAGFSLPTILYLVAWAYGSAIHFATRDNDVQRID